MANGKHPRTSEDDTLGRSDGSADWSTWQEWFREDFLRACFVGGSLAWDGLGALQVRYLVDPYYPGQGSAPAWVYAAMIGFVLASLVPQALLYRWGWSSHGRLRRRGPANLGEFQAQAQQKRY